MAAGWSIVPTTHVAVYQAAAMQAIFEVGGDHQESLCLAATSDFGQMIGGIAFSLYLAALFVQTLWVAEPFRGRGVGRDLLQRAERYAMTHGCRQAIIETYSFLAPEFYLRHGYREVARVDGFGHDQKAARLSLMKELVSN